MGHDDGRIQQLGLNGFGRVDGIQTGQVVLNPLLFGCAKIGGCCDGQRAETFRWTQGASEVGRV